MNDISEARLRSIPKWAQNYIRQILRSNEEMMALLKQDTRFADDLNSPGLHIHPGIGNTPHRALNTQELHGSVIILEDGQQFTIYLDEPHALGLNHNDRRARRLFVMPRAANSVYLIGLGKEGQA